MLHVLPTLWFRNRWSWGRRVAKPEARLAGGNLEIDEPKYGRRRLYARGAAEWLFTENESNCGVLWNTPSLGPYVKDGIDACIVRGRSESVNPEQRGTKAAAHYILNLEAGAADVIEFRLTDGDLSDPFADFDGIFADRIREADEFYAGIVPRDLSDDGRTVMRQALAGLLWSKQFYHYVVRDWLKGDPNFPPPPVERLFGRNHEWTHLYNSDVISMPEKWEYPWYAAWDLAFHCVPLALVDSEFAKEQITLMMREWYMHPNGQLPAYEWESRRRQSAGACVGGVARLQDRAEAARQSRTVPFSSASSTNCC